MHQKLFVWEPDVPEKVKESSRQLFLILGLFFILLLARFYRW